MEAKKRKVEEARASSSNSLDFHDVVDDRVEKNPCSDSSDIHESSINTISTASNVTIAAPLLACTTHLTSPVASTSANISCTTLISETPLSAVTPFRILTPLQGSSCQVGTIRNNLLCFIISIIMFLNNEMHSFTSKI